MNVNLITQINFIWAVPGMSIFCPLPLSRKQKVTVDVVVILAAVLGCCRVWSRTLVVLHHLQNVEIFEINPIFSLHS